MRKKIGEMARIRRIILSMKRWFQAGFLILGICLSNPLKLGIFAGVVLSASHICEAAGENALLVNWRKLITVAPRQHAPEGTSALVGIPKRSGVSCIKESGQTIWKNGKPTKDLHKLVFHEETEHYIQFHVPPGFWSFDAVLEPEAPTL